MAEDEAAAQEPDPRGAWSPGGIAIAAVVLSSLPAGVLHALNYVRLGRPELKRRALVRNLLGFLVSIVVADLTFGLFGTFFVQVAYAVYFQNSQGGLFARHLARGGKKASVILPALGWFVALVGPLALGYAAFDSIETGFDRGIRMMDEGRYDEAEAIFLDYAESEPEDPWTNWNLAVIYDNQDEPEKALARIRIVIRKDPRFDGAAGYLVELEQRVNFARALQLMDEDRLDEAKKIFLEYLERGPEERETRWNLAVIYEGKGELDEAIKQLAALTQAYPDYTEAREYLTRLKRER